MSISEHDIQNNTPSELYHKGKINREQYYWLRRNLSMSGKFSKANYFKHIDTQTTNETILKIGLVTPKEIKTQAQRLKSRSNYLKFLTQHHQ